jgi:mono/diheme cytochrome c family protein
MGRYILVAILASAPLAVASGLLAAPIAYRLPPEIAGLRPAPGMDLVVANCGACHSLDYISTQPPRRGAEFWQAAVTKMIRTYGAPVADADTRAIIAYLAANY